MSDPSTPLSAPTREHADQEAVVSSLALDHGVISIRDAITTIRDARKSGEMPLWLLTERRLMSVEQILAIVASELGLEFVDLFASTRGYSTDTDLIGRCDIDWLERYCAIPMRDASENVVVASADPTAPALDDYLNKVFEEGHRSVLASPTQIRNLLAAEASELLASDFEEERTVALENVGALGNPVIDWLDAVMISAAAQNASDLHFEIGYDRRLMVRFRVDGDLVVQPMPLPGRENEVLGALMNRVRMDTANQREPQDGSFAFTATGGRRIDVRAAMVPLETGPKVVLRLLDPANLRSLGDLGFGQEALDLLQRALSLTQGMVVVTGPTGAGKTTTLYGMVMELAGPQRNIMTVENPIEYRLPHVSQIPVRDDLGERSVTFARALRTILRLDPDVVLVGEVRDAETTKVALDASLTGHLVLTTIHAPSAIGIATRFIEMGGPAYLVAEGISLAVSQRLVKRLHACRDMVPPTDSQRSALESYGYRVPDLVGQPVGCPACQNKGHRGRVALAELLAPNDDLRSAIALRRPMEEIERIAEASAEYVPMRRDGQRLLDAGEVSTNELIRVTASADL